MFSDGHLRHYEEKKAEKKKDPNPLPLMFLEGETPRDRLQISGLNLKDKELRRIRGTKMKTNIEVTSRSNLPILHREVVLCPKVDLLASSKARR